MILSARFEQALVYAAVVHAGQLRKGTEIPYVAHVLGVASIALEYGANEDEAIAALSHDAVEVRVVWIGWKTLGIDSEITSPR